MANPGVIDTRRENAARIYEWFRRRGALSQIDLVRLTGLGKATVSSLCQEALAGGWLVKRGKTAPVGAGKPADLLALAGEAALAAGVEIEADRVVGELFDFAGLSLRRIEANLAPGYEALLDAVVDVVTRLVASRKRSAWLGVGVALYAVVDPSRNRVLESSRFDLARRDLAEDLTKRLRIPVRLCNVLSAAARLESLALETPPERLLHLYAGTGVGICLVEKGRIYEGTDSFAGQLGQMRSAAGGPTLEEQFGLASLGDGVEKTRTLFLEREPGAVSRLQGMAAGLAWGASAAVCLLAPDTLVLSGPLAAFGEDFHRFFEDRLRQLLPFYLSDRLRVRLSHDLDAGPKAAARLLLDGAYVR